jgi:hypothetical protein
MGVYRQSSGLFQACIYTGGREHLGHFDTPEEAALVRARASAARKQTRPDAPADDSPTTSAAARPLRLLGVLQERLDVDAAQRASGMDGMPAEERAQLAAAIERLQGPCQGPA